MKRSRYLLRKILSLSTDLHNLKKNFPRFHALKEENNSWEQAPLDPSSSPAVTLKGGHFLSSYCCFLFSLKGMAVLLKRNEREWENKEKKQKQIQIQFFKDSVNSRYEISYEAAQPRYFVVWYCCCVTRARPRLMHTSSANKTEVQRWVLHLSRFPQQSHYDTNFTNSVIKLKQSRMSVYWALLHLLFGVGNTNSTSFNITETKFLKGVQTVFGLVRLQHAEQHSK